MSAVLKIKQKFTALPVYLKQLLWQCCICEW